MLYEHRRILLQPGLTWEEFLQGLETKDNCKIVVGSQSSSRKQQTYYIRSPSHIKKFPYIQEGLRDGSIQLDQEGPILLPEEDSEAFNIFLVWLYQGLPKPNEATNDPTTWTKLYVMLDKWSMFELAQAVFEHISNLLNAYMCSHRTTYPAAIACYRLLSKLPARYLVVHIAAMVQQYTCYSIANIHEELENTNWGNDFARWTGILPRFARARFGMTTTYRSNVTGPPTVIEGATGSTSIDVSYLNTEDYSWNGAQVSRVDMVLMPLLFDNCDWAKWMNDLAPPTDMRADRREAIREHLGMNTGNERMPAPDQQASA